MLARKPWKLGRFDGGFQVFAAQPLPVSGFDHAHASNALHFTRQRDELAPPQALCRLEFTALVLPPRRARLASECDRESDVFRGVAVERRTGVGFELVRRDEAGIRRDGKAPALCVLTSHERTQYSYAGMPLYAPGHH